jgi:hypothetical protein
MTIGGALLKGYNEERAFFRKPSKPKKKKSSSNQLTASEVARLRAMARGGF